ncbi:MAG: pyroglutamyl-peptidase I [Armatimonadota bacterium]
MVDPDASPLLLTAFEPFGGDQVNASLELARRLVESMEGIELLVLPVVAGAAEQRVHDRLADPTSPYPSAIVSLGEAGPELRVRLEWVYVNFDDFRIPDNSGAVRSASPIDPDGPAAYFASVDLPGIARETNGSLPLPVELSLSAGAFLCNHLAYCVSHARPGVPYAFIHVPAWRPGDGIGGLENLVATVSRVLAEVRSRTPNDTLPR